MNRIRFAVNNAQWPMMWPTPHPMTTRLELGGDQGSRLELPLIDELIIQRQRCLTTIDRRTEVTSSLKIRPR